MTDQVTPPAAAATKAQTPAQVVELLLVDASNSVHVHAVAGPTMNADATPEDKGAADLRQATSKAAAGYSEIRLIAASMGVNTDAEEPGS